MLPLPNLFVLGPPRTGTTSLARWLTDTPNIDVCRPKEPAYHALDLPMAHSIGDKAEYLGCFDADLDVRYRCDATPWYLFSAKAPASIFDMSPDAKLIVRLRNPVDMLVSLHNHHRYVGIEEEPDFEKAVFSARPPSNTDFRTHLDYLGVARVGEQVQRYADTFSREQMYFMRFENASRDTAGTHTRLLDWLGLEPTPLDAYERLNQARQPRVAAIRTATDWMIQPGKPRVMRATGFRIRKANTVQLKARTSTRVRRRILEELADDIDLLSDVSGKNVKAWWL